MLQNGIPAEMAKEDVATFMRGGTGALYATTDNPALQDAVFQQGTALMQELAMTKQKLAIMHKLVDELRTYIEMLELSQPDEEGSIDMNAVAKKLGMNSQKELYDFLHDRAGLPDIAETK